MRNLAPLVGSNSASGLKQLARYLTDYLTEELGWSASTSCSRATWTASLSPSQVLRGLRESLTVAGQVGHPVEAVNAVLHHLQAACDGCIVLTRPYAGEPRVVVTVVAWDELKRAAGPNA
jgi:hypothetical protein